MNADELLKMLDVKPTNVKPAPTPKKFFLVQVDFAPGAETGEVTVFSDTALVLDEWDLGRGADLAAASPAARRAGLDDGAMAESGPLTQGELMKTAPFIFVCKDGWVYVARIAEVQRDSLMIATSDLAVIRRWGTQVGLGELAAKGPLPETILDPEPPGVIIGRLDVKRQIPCDQKAWAKWPKE